MGAGALTAVATAPTANPIFANLSAADTFLLHSRPTASKRIFLDFDGYTTASSAWENGGALQVSAYKPYSGDLNSEVQQIWKTIAEYFSPFDVDVTTQDPGSDRLSKTGGSDSEWGIRAVFAANQMNLLTGQRITVSNPGSGGQTYIGSFNWGSDEPALIFITTGSYDAAVAGAHEIGHSLGLRHQGSSSTSYYSGHGGSAVTSWCPIMGAPYLDGVRENLVTWSDGDYYGSNNKEDALSIITTYNGFGFRPDDAGDNFTNAKNLAGISFQQFGVIEKNTDIDVYSFLTGPGNVSIQIGNATQAWIASGSPSGDPYLSQSYSNRLVTPGLCSLDIAANLYDASGNLLATSNPADSLSASFNLSLPGGRYYVSVDGAGYGNPFSSSPTGYTDYGILGQYVVSGQVQDSLGLLISGANPLITNESGASASLQVSLSSAPSAPVAIRVSSDNPGEGVANLSWLQFTSANWNVPQTVIVTGQDDAFADGRVAYNIVLDPSASTAPEYQALAPRRLAAFNDDNDLPILSFSGPTSAALEGTDSSVSFKLSLSTASTLPVSLTFSTADGTATAGSDYVATNQKLVIPAGQTQLLVPVNLINNSIAEPDESFSASITSVINAKLVGPALANAAISDTLSTATSTTLPSGIDGLRLSGTDAINGTGNTGPNLIIGNAAANVLKGGGGTDTLTGMGGLDAFDLTGISSSANADTITDFVSGVGGEKLLLSNSLTSRSNTGAPLVRSIASLSANSLILETGKGVRPGATPGYDLFLVNAPMIKTGVDLSTSVNGSELLDGLYSGSGLVKLTTTTSGGTGYIGAYDNDNFYLYWFTSGSRDTTITINEIQLIGVLDSSSAISPGALVASNFQMV